LLIVATSGTSLDNFDYMGRGWERQKLLCYSNPECEWKLEGDQSWIAKPEPNTS